MTYSAVVVLLMVLVGISTVYGIAGQYKHSFASGGVPLDDDGIVQLHYASSYTSSFSEIAGQYVPSSGSGGASFQSSFAGQTSIPPRPGCETGWGGKCFFDIFGLWGVRKCDALVVDAHNCPLISFKRGLPIRECCCVDCSQQTEECNAVWNSSVARNPCCPEELKVGEIYPESGCSCCQKCKLERICKKRNGECVTDADPGRNVTWCLGTGGKIKENWCHGEGCYCCYRK